MLEQKQLQTFLQTNYGSSILSQAQSHQTKDQQSYRTFYFDIDLFNTIKTSNNIAILMIGNYPHFVKILQTIIIQLLDQHNLTVPIFGCKIFIYFQNCLIPRHNIKSTQFVQACISQPNGVLVYLKDAQIVGVQENQFYLQSWNEVYEYQCECRFQGTQQNRLLKKKVTQSLLDIITDGNSSSNLKIKSKPQQSLECLTCRMNLKYLGNNDQKFEHCQKIEVIVQTKTNYFDKNYDILPIGNLTILLDKATMNKVNAKKGDIIDMCCFLKTNVELVKSFTSTGKTSAEFSFLIYMICSYPQQFYLAPQNNLFFGKIRDISLEQKPINKISQVHDIVSNYKNLIQTINKIKYPYIGENNLTAMKLVTLASIFSHQGNREKLSLLIITDEVSMLLKCLEISGISIKKFPSIYDQKTISNFFNSCNNSIVLITNPQKRENSIIMKILQQQLYENLNFVLWVITEPDQQLRKSIKIDDFDMVLDLTVEKNLNVCENVYVTMIDNFLQSFVNTDQDEDEFVRTMTRKFAKKFNGMEEYDNMETQMKKYSQNETVKEERLANDIIRRYFLKSREFKTTKMNNISTITKIAQSFTQLRYFIFNKCFSQNKANNPTQKYISVLDVILAIFIDEETSRNKYSKANTLFSQQVSKIMLNQNNCDVSIWDYEIENDYVQQTKRYIPRDQLVGIVVTKIFNLIYED